MKKIWGFLLLFVLFFANIGNVYAKTLAINDVAKTVNESDMFEFLNSYDQYDLSARVNTATSKLEIYNENQLVDSFTYGADYIESANSNLVITKENALEESIRSAFNSAIIQSVLILSGKEYYDIKEDADYTNTYDEYGLTIKSTNVDLDLDNGEHLEGLFITYLKISLDTEKINKLVEKYGIFNPYGASAPVIAALTPELEIDEVTDSSVTLHPSIPYTNSDPEFKVLCEIYRANGLEGEYTKITKEGVDCIHGGSYVDKGLESNKTYYYKTIVQYAEKYSEPQEVTTKAKAATAEGDTVKIPSTGVFFPTIAFVVIAILGSFTIIYIKRHDF